MTTSFNSRISRDFSRAAHSYDGHAILQRIVSDRLFCLWQRQEGTILDIGCGTGYFHELLRKNKIYQPLVQTDIASEMCNIAASYASPPEYGLTHSCISDMHQLPFTDSSFTNIFSSMTLQWSQNRSQVFSEINRILKENGNFALSIVANGSLTQLHEAFTSAGHLPPIHKFACKDDIESELKKAGLKINNISSEVTTLHFGSLLEIIKSIKGVGASYKENRQGGIKGKGYFSKIQEIYQDRFADKNGLPLSWNIIYVTGSK